MANELLSGGKSRKRQVRPVRKDGWTQAKRRIFLDHLAATCNVRRSAETAGMGEHGAYALRRRDPAFAAQWQAAIEHGYATIEATLMARALAPPDATLPERQEGDPLTPDPAGMDTELALGLLKWRDQGERRTKRVGPPPRVATREELTQALLARIARVKQRRAGRQ